MEAVTFIVLAIAIGKIFQAVKSIRAGDYNTPLSLVGLTVIGFLVLWLAGSADVSEHIEVLNFTQTLGQMDIASLVLISLLLATGAGKIYDFQKAVDNTTTSDEPSLFPSLKRTPTPPT
jgi:hypothetical protein